MIKEDEDALICDLAQTYKIYDYKQLPASKVAVFACGLSPDSRIKMKILAQKVPTNTLLLAHITDMLNLLLWSKTKDGQKNKNRPHSIVKDLYNEKDEKRDIEKYTSGEDFERARKTILKKIGGEA